MARCFLSLQGAPHAGEGDDSVAGPEQRPRRAPSRTRALLFSSLAPSLGVQRGGQAGEGKRRGHDGHSQRIRPGQAVCQGNGGGLTAVKAAHTHPTLLPAPIRSAPSRTTQVPLRLCRLQPPPPFSVAATGRKPTHKPPTHPKTMQSGLARLTALQGSAPDASKQAIKQASEAGSRQEASEPSPW